MSTAEGFDARTVEVLDVQSHRGLRVSLTGPDANPRDLLRGEATTEQLRAVVRHPGAATDLVATFWSGVHLMSDRFRRFLDDSDITGWRASPVTVISGESVEALHLLSVTGRCGPIYGIDGRAQPGLLAAGLRIDVDRWDGSDLFVADRNNTVLVAPRAAELLRDANLTNVELKPAGLQPLFPTDGSP